MKRKRKMKSLNRTILSIVLFGYCTVMIVLVCMDIFMISAYQERQCLKKTEAVDNYIKETAAGVDGISKILYDIRVNDDDFKALSGNLSEAQRYSHAYELRESLRGYMMLNKEFHGFYIFYGNGTPLYQVNNEQIMPEQARRMSITLQQLDKQQEVLAKDWFCLTVEEDIFLVTFCKKGAVSLYGIRNIGDAEHMISEESERKAEICLIENGMILTNKETAERYDMSRNIAVSKDKTEYHFSGAHIYGKRVDNTALWVCAVFRNTFQDYVNVSQIFLLFLTGCAIVIAAGIYLFLKKNLVMPLKSLRTEMEKVRNESVKNVPIMNLDFAELREMNETLCEMVTKLEEQKTLVYDAYIEKQKARLQYLQLQIQPHFYLNGLKTLNALVMEQQMDEAQTLILSLSEHLRYLLQAEKEVISLQQEIAFSENYINVRQQMTGRCIQYQLDVEETAYGYNVPMLSVQTFVENSIKYGKTGGTSIALFIRVSVSVLEIEDEIYLDIIIKDNGQGYSPEILEEINAEPEAGSKSVGIQNLQRRSQILYKGKAEFMFYNRNGAVSECIFPAEIKRSVKNEGTDCR